MYAEEQIKFCNSVGMHQMWEYWVGPLDYYNNK